MNIISLQSGRIDGAELPESGFTSDLGAPAAAFKGMHRPRVAGKFLFVGEEKFWARGVTYGTFKPDNTGVQFPSQEVVEKDFGAMAAAGVNAIRVYTPPPVWLMDAAANFGLRVMVGLPWEQHITFLDEPYRAERILNEVRENVRRLTGHLAILCYAVGNEIPASVVRWYGKSRLESFIARLGAAVKSEDPGALVTYVNFPTTEYLDLQFLDFLAFNVYLESREKLSSYLARLQNLAGEQPLIMAEIGLDSRRNGEERQAEALDWQIATAFEGGCVGAFVFAWTDEWFRGGHDITDWDFGLTNRDRMPKRALNSVSKRFASVPFSETRWPRISVVVCSCNGSRTIGETLEALHKLDYSDYEIIVVDDGSTDQTSVVAGRYNVHLIRTENNGLSFARNLGMKAATGEIVAYIDDDAYPDPHWLTYLASVFMRTDHAGVGGPNLAPPADGEIASCVANAPGGPVHVLLSDEVAEHIPGCNMAFRRERLMEIGGFDPQFRVAGDDVDLCWRLQERGWTLGFAPTAVVWHHRRNSIRGYFKQQRGYAKAEALLAEKWPSKYNSIGHLTWQGRLYGKGVVEPFFQISRIYHGSQGTALFQSLYHRNSGWASMMLMPEWYFLLAFIGCLTMLAASWAPLLWLSPLLAMAGVLTLIQAARGGSRARFNPEPVAPLRRLSLRALVALFHLAQPLARLLGRVQHGLGPWNWRDLVRVIPVPRWDSFWSEEWEPLESHLMRLEKLVKQAGAQIVAGGDFDAWDLSIHGGLFGTVRIVAVVEEHGSGRQLFRFRAWPKPPTVAVVVFFGLVTLAGLAGWDHAWVACGLLALTAAVLGLLIYADCAIALSHWRNAVDRFLQRNGSLRTIGSGSSATGGALSH